MSHPQFDTQSLYQKVREFRYKMKLTVSLEPRLMTWQELSFYARFINELLKAHEDQDLVGAADALGDLVYLLVGAAQTMGVPLDKVIAAIHRANMDKEPGESKRHKNDVRKPLDWVGPEAELKALLLPRVPTSTLPEFFNE